MIAVTKMVVTKASVNRSFVDKLRRGEKVTYLWIDVTGSKHSNPLPLDGFSTALDGAPKPAKRNKEDQKKIAEIIKQRSGGKLDGDKERQLGFFKPSDLKRRRLTNGDWYKLCIDVPVADRGKPDQYRKVNVCLTQVDFRDEETAVLVSKVAIRQIAGQDKPQLMAMMPLGVGIMRGVSARIDDGEAIKLAFTTCDQAGCYAEANVDPSYVDKLENRSRLSFSAIDEVGEPAFLDQALNGFSGAFDGPAIPTEKLNEDQRKIAEVIRERQERLRGTRP